MKRLPVLPSTFTTITIRPLLLAAGLSGLALGAQAQGQPGKGKPRGTIQDAEIEIVKDRVNTLPEATRNFEKIRLAPPPPPATRQPTYTYPDFRLPVTRLSPSVQVLPVAQEELEPLTGNYLKLGFGNYGSVYGRAHLHSVRNSQYSYGLDVRHNSSRTGPVDGRNSGAGQTSAALTGEYYLGTAAVGAALDYAHDVYHYYGYDAARLVVSPDKDAIRQAYNRFGVRAYARNRTPDAQLTYEAGVGFRHFGDHYGMSENNLLLDGKAGYALGGASRITVDAQGSFISDQQPSRVGVGPSELVTRKRNFFQVTPAYELSSKTGLSLTLGLTYGYSGDTLNNVSKSKLNPAVRVGYAVVPEKFQVYGGLGGAIQRVTRYDLSQENPWLAPGQRPADTHAGPTVYAGFTAAPVSGLELAARATLGRSRNLYFYRNILSDTSQFALVYDPATINVVNVHAEALYSATEKVRVGFKADYNHYGVKNLARAYGRSPFLGTLYGTYNATDKLLLGVTFYYYAANYGAGYYLPNVVVPGPGPYFPTDYIDRKTNAVVDLNLRADYRITPKFSIFALGNNLANRHYQRYLNYQSQGINVIGGLTYSF